LLISLLAVSAIVFGFALLYPEARQYAHVRQEVQLHVASAPVASIGQVYVDEQGVVTYERPAVFVPHIDALISPPSAGDVITDPSVLMVIRTIGQFERAYLAVEHATIYNENYIELVVSDQVKVVSTHATDPFYLVSTVKSIHQAYEIEGRSIDVIDVRFSKPFVIERYGP